MPAKDNNTTIPQRTRRRGQRMTPDEKTTAKEVFLNALKNTANVRAACLQAGVDASTVYRWQEHDEEFGMRFREANRDANWLLFAEAWRRAMQGDKEYVVSSGKLVYDADGNPLTVQRRSDRMLELLLKARLPEFRERQQVEHSGALEIINNAKDSLLSKLTTITTVTDAETQKPNP